MKKEKKFWGVLLSTSVCFIVVTIFLLMNVIYPYHVEEHRKRGRDTIHQLQFVLPFLEPAQRQLYLEHIAEHGSELSYLLLMDVDGRATAHSNPRRVGISFDSPDVQHCIKNGGRIEQIYTRDPNNPSSPYHKEKTIDITEPYRASDGTVTGAVSVGISLKEVQGVKQKYYIIAGLCCGCWLLFISAFAIVHYRSNSQRRRDETALRESEERFHTIFSECPIPIILSEVPGGTYTDANKQFLKYSALGRDEVIGETALSLGVIEPAEAARIKDLLYADGLIDGEEIETVGRNGEPKTSILSARFITISGKPFVLSMLQDITERKRTEEALARSEANYRNLFDNAPIGVFQSTTEGRFLSVNKAFADIFGYESPEDVLESVTDIGTQIYTRKEDRLAMLRQAINSAHITCNDFEFLRKNGTPFFVTLYMRAVRNAEGLVEMLEGFFVDTTERKRAFEVLRESEERLWLYMQRLPLPCIVFDSRCIIRDWNPAAEKVFGYSEQEALGTDFNDLIIPATARPQTDEVWKQLLEGRFDADSTNYNVTKDGRTIVCEWSNTPLVDSSGNISGIISVAQDITEKVRARDLLIQHEKMLMIGGLAAGMAHEINNPLSIIIQSTQIIEQRLHPGSHKNCAIATSVGLDFGLVSEYMKRRELFDFLANIRRSGERAAKIVRNMLAFSRSGFSKRGPADINRIIDHAIEITSSDYDIKKQCNFGNVLIHRDYAEGLPEVTVNVSEIEQAVISLLKNAGHALAAGVTEPVIRVTTCREKDDLVIVVADNGPGMTKSVRHRIFEPFFTTREVGDGMGLGLYVSYLIIVNNHNGQIIVDSTLGKGTAFTIRLPLQGNGMDTCRNYIA